jgi:hypothetical protein
MIPQELVEVLKAKVYKPEGHNWTKTTDDEQPYQTTKAFYMVIAITFKGRYKQLDHIENESWKPAHEVKNEDQDGSRV